MSLIIQGELSWHTWSKITNTMKYDLTAGGSTLAMETGDTLKLKLPDGSWLKIALPDQNCFISLHKEKPE